MKNNHGWWVLSETSLRRRITVSTLMFLVFAYMLGGAVLFPDGPIRKCDTAAPYSATSQPNGYCGKRSQSHTQEDFRSFELWSAGFFGIVPIFLIGAAIVARKPSGD